MTGVAARYLCVGAAHWDIVARADGAVGRGDDLPGRIDRRPGGVALNVALGLADLGCPVALCAAVGAEGGGAALLSAAAARGVDCRQVVTVAGATAEAYVAIEDHSGRLTAAVADTSLLEAEEEAVVERASLGLRAAAAIFLEANLPRASVDRLAEMARSAGTELIANPVSPAKAARLAGLLAGAPGATIIANLAEASVLTGVAQGSAEDAARALRALGAEVALVTDGLAPAALATPAGVVAGRPRRLPSGTSLTGAGDALISGYLASAERRDRPQAALDFALGHAADQLRKRVRDGPSPDAV